VSNIIRISRALRLATAASACLFLSYQVTSQQLPSGKAAPEASLVSGGMHIAQAHVAVPEEVGIAFEPSGRLVAVAREGRVRDTDTVVVWEVETGRELRRIDKLPRTSALVLSENAQWLALGMENQRVELREVGSGRPVRSWQAAKRIDSLAFSPGSQLLASVCKDQPAAFEVWDVRSGRSFGIFSGTSVFAVSPDGGLIAHAWSQGDTIVVLSSKGGDKQLTLPVSGQTGSLLFSGDRQTLVRGTGGNYVSCPIEMWDLKSSKLARRLLGHTGRVTSLALSPDGHVLASTSIDHSIRLWDLDSGQCMRTVYGRWNALDLVKFSPDGKRIAAVGRGERNPFWLWDAATGSIVLLGGESETSILSTAATPGREAIAVLYREPEGIALLDVRSGLYKWGPIWGYFFGARFPNEHESRPSAIAFDGGGKILAVAAGVREERTPVTLWARDTGALVGRYACSLAPLELMFSEDGHRLRVLGEQGREETINLTREGRTKTTLSIKVALSEAPGDIDQVELVSLFYDEILNAARARGYTVLSPAALPGASAELFVQVRALNRGGYGPPSSFGTEGLGLAVQAELRLSRAGNATRTASCAAQTPLWFKGLQARSGAVYEALKELRQNLRKILPLFLPAPG